MKSKRTGKPVFFVVFLLILALTYTAFFGIENYYGDTRTVDMHVQRIRRKIDTQPNKFIQTVFGIGYKMRKI